MTDNNRPMLKVNDGPFRSLDEQNENNSSQSNRIRSRSLNPDVTSMRNISRRVHEEQQFKNLNSRLADIFKRRHQTNPIENDSSIEDLKKEHEKFIKIYETTKKENTKLTLLHSRINGELNQRSQRVQRLEKEVENLKQQIAQKESEIDGYKLQVGELKDTNAILNQELNFKVNLYEKQAVENKKKFEMSYKQIETQIKLDLDAKFEAERQEMIEAHLHEKNKSREAFERHHNSVLDEFKIKYNSLESKNKSLELEYFNLRNLYNELVNQNEGLKQKHEAEMKKWDDLSRRKDEICSEQTKMLQDELESERVINFKLIEELRKFRKLLEAEEKRMNITPQSMSSPVSIEKENYARERDLGSPLTSSSMIENSNDSGKKRRRIEVESEEQLEVCGKTKNQVFNVEFSNGNLMINNREKPRVTQNAQSLDEPGNGFSFFSFWKK